jgi:hypothetical protein
VSGVPIGSVRSVRSVTAPDQRGPSQPCAVLVDPLSPEHVLLPCNSTGRVYRMTLASGAVDTVTGYSGPPPSKGFTGEVPASNGAHFSTPVSMVVAPRELWCDRDALTLLLSDYQNVFVIRVPH